MRKWPSCGNRRFAGEIVRVIKCKKQYEGKAEL